MRRFREKSRRRRGRQQYLLVKSAGFHVLLLQHLHLVLDLPKGHPSAESTRYHHKMKRAHLVADQLPSRALLPDFDALADGAEWHILGLRTTDKA